MIGGRARNSDTESFSIQGDREKSSASSRGSLWQRWSLKKKIAIGVTILLVIVAIAVGLGVGLTLAGSGDEDTGGDAETPPSNGTKPGGIWKPVAGTSWNYELRSAVEDVSADADVWDIDLFDNDQETIASLQSERRRVLCYFSAGSYEEWRQDKDKFQESDMGNDLNGWEGERWLDTNSENVRKIMQSRMDMAVQKKCDGVEPDNVDAYDNENGLDLTQSDAIDYATFLADEAHSRNLSIALKNAGAIVPSVIDLFESSVQEQCIEFDSCEQFMPFIEANKPVFHVEYPKGVDTNNNDLVATPTKQSICGNSQAAGFSTILKNIDLDGFIESCPSN